MSNRRPSLQVDGIIQDEIEDNSSSQTPPPRTTRRPSLPGNLSETYVPGHRSAFARSSLAQDPNSLLNPKNKIISRSTKALSGSMEIKETLDAKAFDDDAGERRLNQYIMGKILGKGSFGTVYKALNKDDNIYYAIKEFSKTKLKKQKMAKSGMILFGRGRGRGRGGVARPPVDHTPENPIELVRGEIAILKKLNHINVVKLFEVLDDPSQDYLYMVFELCEKGCIMDISMEKSVDPLPRHVALNYMRQMILGIEYLHENNISHRDIKPDNMMISADGTLKIVDFGVSEIFANQNDKLAKSAGSPAFYPPENCIAHHGEISAKAADVWSLGVTLYCLIYGKLPFTGGNILLLYESIRNDPIPLPQNEDPVLVDLFTKILDKNADTRMTMDQLRDHPWITENGKNPLISKDENCYDLIEDITESELNTAIKPIANIFTIIKAVSKLKNLGKSSHALDKSSQNLNSSPSNASIQDSSKASLNLKQT